MDSLRDKIEQIYCDNCPPMLHCGEGPTACKLNKDTTDQIISLLAKEGYGKIKECPEWEKTNCPYNACPENLIGADKCQIFEPIKESD